MATDRVKDSIVVNADPDTVLEVVADFESYPEWQDEFQQAEILETDADGWGTKARFVVSSMGVSVTMTLAYTYGDNVMSWTLVDSDKMQRNDGSYTLVPKGNQTEVVYDLAVETSVPLPGFVRKQLAKKIVSGALAAVKARAESAD